MPMDLVVFNELRIVGSLGCPISSYTGMLSMVAAGLQPTRLVETVGSVADAGKVLERHDELQHPRVHRDQQLGRRDRRRTRARVTVLTRGGA